MVLYRSYVRAGMRVVASDGNEAGTVADTRADGFVIRRAGASEVTIPYGSIQNVMGDEVILNIPTGQIGTPIWPNPPIAGG